MSIDINKLDKINTELITPTVNENIIETERDKWGNILNEKTFKTLNNNIKFLKDIISEIINNINILNLDDIKLRLKNIETDTTKLESLININEQKTEIVTGINTSNYNIVGNGEHLKYNGKDLARLDEVQNISSPIDTTNFAKLDTSNTFTQKIKGTDIESNKIITNELIWKGINVDLSNISNSGNNNNNNTSQIESKLEKLFKITTYDNLNLFNTNNGVAKGYTIGNIALFNFHDVSPIKENGQTVICTLPVVPLSTIEGTAVIIGSDMRSERFSVDTEGNVRIVGDGRINTYLKYSFSFSFPFNL